MINNVSLMGRLTKSPELRTTMTGKSVLNFTIAVDNPFSEKADFINCVAWEGTAEFIDKYFKKGNLIGIEGKIQTNEFHDKEGRFQISTEVNVREVHFTGERLKNKERREEEEKEFPNIDIIEEEPIENTGDIKLPF